MGNIQSERRNVDCATPTDCKSGMSLTPRTAIPHSVVPVSRASWYRLGVLLGQAYGAQPPNSVPAWVMIVRIERMPNSKNDQLSTAILALLIWI